MISQERLTELLDDSKLSSPRQMKARGISRGTFRERRRTTQFCGGAGRRRAWQRHYRPNPPQVASPHGYSPQPKPRGMVPHRAGGDQRHPNMVRNVGWTKPDDWPVFAQHILKFVRPLPTIPEPVESMREIAAKTKGVQSAFLSPILNALNPDDILDRELQDAEDLESRLGPPVKRKDHVLPSLERCGVRIGRDASQSISSHPARRPRATSSTHSVIGTSP